MPLVSFKFYDCDQLAGTVTFLERHEFNISVAQLVLAALTVGRPSWSAVLQYGNHSVFECIWRAAMVMSNVAVDIRTNGAPYLTASQAFMQLDPSEKGAATFFIGGAMTKIVSEKFGIPALYHLDTIGQQRAFIGPNFPTVAMLAGGNRRPDFIGPNAANRYGVFESKGRSHTSDNNLRLSAKEQTTMIDTINGHGPFCRVACITSFGGGKMTVDVVDPSEPSKEAFSMDTNNADFKEPFHLTKSLLQQANMVQEQTINGMQYKVADLKEADIKFGLRRDILDVVEGGSNDEMKKVVMARGFDTDISFPEGLIDGLLKGEENSSAIGLDGHFVELGPTWKNITKTPTRE